MRTYEIMIIFDRDAEEDSRTAILDNLENGIKDLGGGIIYRDVWGMRNFAYTINHKNEGFYVVLEFTATGELNELERPMRLTDDVVRYKILVLPKDEAERREELRKNPAAAEKAYAHTSPRRERQEGSRYGDRERSGGGYRERNRGAVRKGQELQGQELPGQELPGEELQDRRQNQEPRDQEPRDQELQEQEPRDQEPEQAETGEPPVIGSSAPAPPS